MPTMRGMPSFSQPEYRDPEPRKHRTPKEIHALTRSVQITSAGTGGALLNNWSVPSAKLIDRTTGQYSVADKLEAARKHGFVVSSAEDLATLQSGVAPVPVSAPPGRAPSGPDAFAMRDAFAEYQHEEGYAFVNNKHEQFGSQAGFNESKTSAFSDPKPTTQMRVKSGYTGLVPHGREHIGSTYRSHDNRGSAGKTMVPIPHRNIDPPNDEYLAKMKRNLTYFAGQSAVFQGRMTSHEGSFVDSTAGPSSVKVSERIEKLLEHEDAKGPDGTMATASIGDEHDAKYIKGTGAMNAMVGYTGHVPRAYEVIASSHTGPTIGASHHGPAMEPDPMGFVPPSNPNKVADCA